jgi:serine-type D-Ala-D-Ala carboxypeptidase (penicillin-binding protein 5/6)
VRRLVSGLAGCLVLALTTAAATTPATRRGSPAPVGGPQLGSHGIVVNYPAHHPRRLPRVPASAYVIADAGTGKVLAAKDPHGRYGPASTLKVLTAVTLMPVLRPDQTVVASRRAADATPSRVGLVAGRTYRVGDLFRALLMISANDAAIALAQATGSYAKGIAMMNTEAHHLQAHDTVAKTPNGLDHKGQHVSAYDEALFARQALAIPWFWKDEVLAVARFPGRPHHRPVKLWNQNIMLQTYPGDLGGKIGWTTPAKATYIGWARRHGHTLIVTILHCRPLAELNAAASLLNWGFAIDGRVRPVGTLVRPLPAVTAAHPMPTHRERPAAEPGSAMPTVPLTVGLATLLLAVITGAVMTRITRRRSQAPARPGPARSATPRPRPPRPGPPRQGQPGQRPPGQAEPGQRPPVQDQPRQDQPRQDQPRQDQPRQGEPRQGQPRQGQPRQRPAGPAPPGTYGPQVTARPGNQGGNRPAR